MTLKFHNEGGIQIIDNVTGLDLVTPGGVESGIDPIIDEEEAYEIEYLLQKLRTKDEKERLEKQKESIKERLEKQKESVCSFLDTIE